MLVPERAACICDTIYFLSLHLVSSGSSFGAVLFESYVFLLWLCVGLFPTSAPGFFWELIWGRAVLTNTCFFLSVRGSLWNLSAGDEACAQGGWSPGPRTHCGKYILSEPAGTRPEPVTNVAGA
jgi:hypothetical protein